MFSTRLSRSCALVIVPCMLALTACEDKNAPAPFAAGTQANTTAPATAGALASLPQGVLLEAAPAGAKPIKELKASVKPGESVTIRAVVGGRAEPIVKQRAVLTLVDASFNKACIGPGENCPTPWDYCCADSDELKTHMATLQIVDSQGAPLKADLAASAIKPLSTLVFTGTVAERPDDATLVINATHVFVEAR